jgi:hypothetical protein
VVEIDESVGRPDLCAKLFASHKITRPLQQHRQHLQRLPLQTKLYTPLPQLASPNVKFEDRIPARTRSWINARSNSAIAPMIRNIKRLDGVLRSRLSLRLMNATLKAASSASRINEMFQRPSGAVDLPDQNPVESPTAGI